VLKLHRSVLAVVSLCVACAPGTGATFDTPQGTPAGVNGNEIRTEKLPPAIIELPYHSADLVWQALPLVFAELKIPAAVMDARGRVFGNGRVVVSSIGGEPVRSMFRCATDGSASSGGTALRLQFGITAAPRSVGPTKTELLVRTTAHATSIEASRSGTIACTSNGLLETRIKRALEAQLAKM